MRKIEYLRITELNMQGSRINELGAEGWKLMHVYPAGHEQDGRCRPNWYTEYLFMREPEVKDEPT